MTTSSKYGKEIDDFYKQGVIESAFYNELIKKIDSIASKKKYEEITLENKREIILDVANILVKHHLYLR